MPRISAHPVTGRRALYALGHGAYRLQDLRRLMSRPEQQQTLAFMDGTGASRLLASHRRYLW